MPRYKIRRNELPSEIAARYGMSTQALLRANPGVTRFSTGLTIKVPPLGGATRQTAASRAISQQMSARGDTGAVSVIGKPQRQPSIWDYLTGNGAPVTPGTTGVRGADPASFKVRASQIPTSEGGGNGGNGQVGYYQNGQWVGLQGPGIPAGGYPLPPFPTEKFVNLAQNLGLTMQPGTPVYARNVAPQSTGIFNAQASQNAYKPMDYQIGIQGGMQNSAFSASTAASMLPGMTPEARQQFLESQGFVYNPAYGGTFVFQGGPKEPTSTDYGHGTAPDGRPLDAKGNPIGGRRNAHGSLIRNRGQRAKTYEQSGQAQDVSGFNLVQFNWRT